MENAQVETSKVTITAALSDLKVLDKRITAAISTRTKFVDVKTAVQTTVGSTGLSEEDFRKNAKAGLQSIEDLIARRAKIKSAIVKSNAETKVKIAGTNMTVAEAIENKSSIAYKQSLLEVLKRQKVEINKSFQNMETEVENKIQQIINTAAGKDSSKMSEEDINTIRNGFKNARPTIVDAIEIDKKINSLEDEISKFTSEVDIALSISNATTMIEV